MISLPKYMLFDYRKYSNAKKDSNSIVEYISREIPNAGIAIKTGR